MSRIALGIAYDGAPWHGWQTQPDGLTVQDTLEKALATFLNQDKAATICAGRTDTGVHALQQVIHLDTAAQRRDESWVRGLNALLPSSIAVRWVRTVPLDFHARYGAQARTYFYLLRCARVRSPHLAGRVGWCYHELNIGLMREAARLFLGEHDFSAFRSAQCQAASPVRTLQRLDVTMRGEFLVFRFVANAFLHHMVRNLMGTLIAIGQAKQPPSWVNHLLAQRDRRLSAPTFAPDGLYLAHVAYPEHYGLPQSSPDEALLTHLGWSLDEGGGIT
ncbi:tRNA pseudouridine(38-40) synthase TruA [Alcaligenaceae bacterium CGII-47]|nr:tRNA pseudouridine(38-40) synthase TruA [Alcaligenaceae bacterium CGII-47]